MTKVINIFGAPSSGKSTTAAGVYHELKLKGVNCELVREYIKEWVWQGFTPNKYDQFYITAKQVRGEAKLFGKVDVIVTDSPAMLGAFYEEQYHDSLMLRDCIHEYMIEAKNDGIEFYNYLIIPDKNKVFDPRGRYGDKEEAMILQSNLAHYLDNQQVKYKMVYGEEPENLPEVILKDFYDVCSR